MPESWYHNSVMYDLLRDKTIDELSERLVIEWGRVTVSWVQSKVPTSIQTIHISGFTGILS